MPTMNGFFDLIGLLTLVTGLYCVWLALGGMARSLGLTRLQVLGGLFLLGWLIG
jgi:hypothetical protein